MPDKIKQEYLYTALKNKINTDSPVISQFVSKKTILKNNPAEYQPKKVASINFASTDYNFVNFTPTKKPSQLVKTFQKDAKQVTRPSSTTANRPQEKLLCKAAGISYGTSASRHGAAPFYK